MGLLAPEARIWSRGRICDRPGAGPDHMMLCAGEAGAIIRSQRCGFCRAVGNSCG